MLTEPDASVSMVTVPTDSETLLPHPSPHNVSDEHDDGKNKFLFTVIHLRYVTEILPQV